MLLAESLFIFGAATFCKLGAFLLPCSIEQDADVVILLHRDDMYDSQNRTGEADLIVAKHRNGPTRTITVSAQLHYARFYDMPQNPGGGTDWTQQREAPPTDGVEFGA